MSDQTPPQDQTVPDPNLQELPQPDVGTGERRSLRDIALEVIDGKWGAGQVRRQRLHDAGYDFREVDAEITEIRNNP